MINAGVTIVINSRKREVNMNLPDKEKIVRKDCYFATEYGENCADCTIREETCSCLDKINEYESQIKPQIESLEAERDQLNKENERLRKTLYHGVDSITAKKNGFFFVQMTLDKETLDSIMSVGNTDNEALKGAGDELY